jgi:hypothetical protein
MRKVRIPNLPTEVSFGVLRAVQPRYGEVFDSQVESWPRHYRYPVAKGFRLAMITITRHISSHITVAGCMVLVSYDGHPMTFYGCNDIGHLYQRCQMRLSFQETAPMSTTLSWAYVAVRG